MEVKDNDLWRKVTDVLKQFQAENMEIQKEMVEIVMLAKWSLELEAQVTKPERFLMEMK